MAKEEDQEIYLPSPEMGMSECHTLNNGGGISRLFFFSILWLVKVRV